MVRHANKKPYITVQPAKDGSKVSTSNLPFGKPINVQDAS